VKKVIVLMKGYAGQTYPSEPGYWAHLSRRKLADGLSAFKEIEVGNVI
jgi:hypothetical protein